MTVIGIDDTDSRTGGMCTTFVAHTVADRLRERGVSVERVLLVRLNPGVEHKTRGNAALAIHAEVDPRVAFEVATSVVADRSMLDDEDTNPAVVVAHEVPEAVADFARRAVTEYLDPGEAASLADAHAFETATWGNGQGLVGALAAVGAWKAFDDWTFEYIAYRESDRWGTERDVDADSAFAAADAEYPAVWDTVDHGEGEVVCVPRTPCPVLYGIRGDDAAACRRAAAGIEGEDVASERTFVTNQGTDVHLVDGAFPDLVEGRAYRVSGVVAGEPETREGGHVFVPFGPSETESRLDLVAFEPTKRFREHVRSLRPGDELTACGEVSDDSLKLEKFWVTSLATTDHETPECESCGRRMKSAGADQGYRCRDCSTHAPGKVEVTVERTLESGWYEVPPRARRHVAKPLVRGGFDGATHPER